MLVPAAAILGVAAADLLPQAGETPAPMRVQQLALVRGADELVAAYGEISSTRHRRTVLQLARVLASSAGREDAAE